VEKNATYVNTEGRVQQTKMAIPPLSPSGEKGGGGGRDD
jgi:NADH dehydrogenase/NADH:ubiquinone oxidoreductase subunit G